MKIKGYIVEARNPVNDVSFFLNRSGNSKPDLFETKKEAASFIQELGFKSGNARDLTFTVKKATLKVKTKKTNKTNKTDKKCEDEQEDEQD